MLALKATEWFRLENDETLRDETRELTVVESLKLLAKMQMERKNINHLKYDNEVRADTDVPDI